MPQPRLSRFETSLSIDEQLERAGKMVSLPPEDRAPPLFNEDWLPTLPTPLLELLEHAFKPGPKSRAAPVFTSQDLARERILADRTASFGNSVGMRGGIYVSCRYLTPKPDTAAEATANAVLGEDARREFGPDADVGPALELLHSLDPILYQCQGYCGWLVTQERFHREHRTLREQLKSFPLSRNLQVGHYVLARAPVLDAPAQEEALQLMRAFLSRWQLASMPAPLVFDLEGPLVHLPVTMVATVRPDAVVTSFPRTAKLPDRDELRTMLDRGPEGRVEAHLAEWLDLVSPDTQSSRRVHWLADLYRVQHYYFALRDRYPAVAQGNKHRAIGTIVAYVRGVGTHAITEKVVEGFAKELNHIDRLIAGVVPPKID